MIHICYNPSAEPTEITLLARKLCKGISAYGMITFFSLGARLAIGKHRDSDIFDGSKLVATDLDIMEAVADPDSLQPSHWGMAEEIFTQTGDILKLTPQHLQSAMALAVYEIQNWTIEGRLMLAIDSDFFDTDPLVKEYKAHLLIPIDPVTSLTIVRWTQKEREIVHRLQVVLYAATEASSVSITRSMESLPDGPIPPQMFKYRNKATPMQRIPWLLLDALWRKRTMPEEECNALVWGPTGASEYAMKAAVGKANDALLETATGMSISRKGGYYILD